ncbi:DNA polymerase III, subunit gamma and tau [[Clostridium] methylpentosum DSM 5476]|uniref:DNA-directed DNA polymerase n=1 Tax=[Clostridium] methylpentosum DSM 5476 TaxID=537013 RepID=C0EFC3_9FIRM|nr:DNA polymerase III, subunit gamma and tau [[Clostridium] methylpentosum DSM 5476]MDY3988786.1 DNA polymerase III subunit gamma/tau [Massilioclostridium sp.]
MYLALYRKWRPKSFEDVLSQPHITTTLINEIKTGHIAHAYLFTGSRGTGKTTCSKILAKAVNCLHPVDGEPCHECECCRGIEDGSILDVVEIDAASNNGVDNIRELRDEANFTPVSCKYRVYIIDEAHMLSTGAFNALLKIMEEPPPHVIFILATTEVHKVPATILSRCQRFDFRRIKAEDIVAQLMKITESEEFSLTQEAAELIARLADGGMRDALSLLDQCVAFSSDITVEVVSSAAGIADREYLFEFHQAVMGRDPAKALALIDELYAKSKDLERLCEELINFYRNLMIIQTTARYKEIVLAVPEELARLEQLAGQLKLSQVIHCLTVLQDSIERFNKVGNKRLEFEICMIKLCSPNLDQSMDSILRRIDRLEAQLRSGVAIPAQQIPSAPPQTPPQQTEEPQPMQQDSAPPPAEEAPEPPSLGNSEREQRPVPLAAWGEILEDLADQSKSLYGILCNSQAFEMGEKLFIRSPNTAFAGMVQGKTALLSRIISDHTGKQYRLLMKGAKQQAAHSAVDEVLERAKQSGIDVIEE